MEKITWQQLVLLKHKIIMFHEECTEEIALHSTVTDCNN